MSFERYGLIDRQRRAIKRNLSRAEEGSSEIGGGGLGSCKMGFGQSRGAAHRCCSFVLPSVIGILLESTSSSSSLFSGLLNDVAILNFVLPSLSLSDFPPCFAFPPLSSIFRLIKGKNTLAPKFYSIILPPALFLLLNDYSAPPPKPLAAGGGYCGGTRAWTHLPRRAI
ncbi:hypothetical protein ACLOJK_028256 [Asimina triloba]